MPLPVCPSLMMRIQRQSTELKPELDQPIKVVSGAGGINKWSVVLIVVLSSQVQVCAIIVTAAVILNRIPVYVSHRAICCSCFLL